MHWLYAFFGWDDPSSRGYLFWSGSGGLVVVWLASVLLIWWHHSCKRAWWCPLVARHEFTDPADGVSRRLCWAHHPDVKSKHLTKARIREIQQRRHLHAVRKLGRS